MKYLFLSLLFSFSVYAGSPGYEISFEMSAKDTPKTLGKIRVHEGATGIISYSGTDIEVLAKEGEVHGHKGIKISFVVKRANEVLSKPEILVFEKKQGQMTVNDKSGEILSLTVTASRVNF